MLILDDDTSGIGPFSGHLDHRLRYDETMPAREDVDHFLQHIHTFRQALRLNMYHYYHNHGSNKGGFASMPTLAVEERSQLMLTLGALDAPYVIATSTADEPLAASESHEAPTPDSDVPADEASAAARRRAAMAAMVAAVWLENAGEADDGWSDPLRPRHDPVGPAGL